MKLKKIFIFFILVLNYNLVFAEKYVINEKKYIIKGSDLPFSGKTQVYALEQNIPSLKIKEFENLSNFEQYIDSIKRELKNLRAFENIEINYSIINSENNTVFVNMNIYLIDSNHLLALPYPKYDSNNGFNFKLKAKDMNFIGTLNPLSTDLFIKYPYLSGDSKKQIGSTLTYNYPFNINKIELTWVNDYSLSYIFDDKTPAWDLKTGIELSLPFKNFDLNFEFYQKSLKDSDYAIYDDEISFTENGIFSIPIKIFNTNFLGNIIYEPYLSYIYCWDYNKINIQNSSLSSPVYSIGQQLEGKRIDWKDNFRKGFSFTLLNKFSYNQQRKISYTFISLEQQLFYSIDLFNSNIFSKIGICEKFYGFYTFTKTKYLSDGNQIGSYLRGIRNEQYYNGTLVNSLNPLSAFLFNFDFPLSILKSDFNYKLLNYFNFDLQISPFIDIGLVQNKITGSLFNVKDGFYSGGFEILIYPKKWSSFTIRGSLGFDLGKTLLKKYINMDWRGSSSPYEIYIGIGLQY